MSKRTVGSIARICIREGFQGTRAGGSAEGHERRSDEDRREESPQVGDRRAIAARPDQEEASTAGANQRTVRYSRPPIACFCLDDSVLMPRFAMASRLSLSAVAVPILFNQFLSHSHSDDDECNGQPSQSPAALASTQDEHDAGPTSSHRQFPRAPTAQAAPSAAARLQSATQQHSSANATFAQPEPLAATLARSRGHAAAEAVASHPVIIFVVSHLVAGDSVSRACPIDSAATPAARANGFPARVRASHS